MLAITISARSWLTGWTYTVKTMFRLLRKHGLRGLGPALQEELEDTNVEVDRVLTGAPAVTLDGGVRIEPKKADFEQSTKQ